uniref:Transmembrane protein n=2 Tax=Rhizophagus irregularis TaxID=588596 RepID=U9U776_RHIID
MPPLFVAIFMHCILVRVLHKPLRYCRNLFMYFSEKYKINRYSILIFKAKMIVKNTIEFVEQKKYLEDKGNIDDQLQNLQNINQAIAHKTSKRVIPNSNNKSKSNSKKLSLNH